MWVGALAPSFIHLMFLKPQQRRDVLLPSVMEVMLC